MFILNTHILEPEFFGSYFPHLGHQLVVNFWTAAPLSHFKHWFWLGMGQPIYFKQEQIGAIIPQADSVGNSQNRGKRIDFLPCGCRESFV